ncbi:hypothetical protein NL676_038722 [Syzygium grande]|nr:hypothetical protein NL676_038722 [Syzygium grande]
MPAVEGRPNVLARVAGSSWVAQTCEAELDWAGPGRGRAGFPKPPPPYPGDGEPGLAAHDEVAGLPVIRATA